MIIGLHPCSSILSGSAFVPIPQHRLYPANGAIVESLHALQAGARSFELDATGGEPHFANDPVHRLHPLQAQREQTAARIAADLQIVAAVARLTDELRDAQ
jgi:hypothetical protein